MVLGRLLVNHRPLVDIFHRGLNCLLAVLTAAQVAIMSL